MAYRSRRPPLWHQARRVLIFASWGFLLCTHPLWSGFWAFATGGSRLLRCGYDLGSVCKSLALWKPNLNGGIGNALLAHLRPPNAALDRQHPKAEVKPS